MASAVNETRDVRLVKAHGHVSFRVQLPQDSQPVNTSILKDVESVTETGECLSVPNGCRDDELFAWVTANKFGCDGMGIKQLSLVVRVSIRLACLCMTWFLCAL